MSFTTIEYYSYQQKGEDGELLYWQILAHSPVDQLAIAGVPMNSTDYCTQTQRGTLNNRFNAITLDKEFPWRLAQQ